QAELGGASRARWQAGVLSQVGALIQSQQQAVVQIEDGDGPVGAGDLVVKFLADDTLCRPAQAVPIEGDRPGKVLDSQGDKEDLRSHSVSCIESQFSSRTPACCQAYRRLGVMIRGSEYRAANRDGVPKSAPMRSAYLTTYSGTWSAAGNPGTCSA